jgi:uncharacterized membrane protein
MGRQAHFRRVRFVMLGKSHMLVLLAISIVSFLALVWATFAIVSHVRRANRVNSVEPPQQDQP